MQNLREECERKIKYWENMLNWYAGGDNAKRRYRKEIRYWQEVFKKCVSEGMK